MDPKCVLEVILVVSIGRIFNVVIRRRRSELDCLREWDREVNPCSPLPRTRGIEHWDDEAETG